PHHAGFRAAGGAERARAHLRRALAGLRAMSFARLEGRLNLLLERFNFVESRMAAASDGGEIIKLAREHAELKPVTEAIAAVRAARQEKADLEALLADPDMAELARADLERVSAALPELERNTTLLLLPKDKDESASAIVEIRAGTGGVEAAL